MSLGLAKLFLLLLVVVLLGGFDSAISSCIEGAADLKPKHSSCLEASKLFLSSIDANRTEILARHNYWRSAEVLKPPPLILLAPLEWHDELAATAQSHANQCRFGHDLPANRVVPANNWTWVGQNLAAFDRTTTFAAVIDYWASERDNWAYGVGPKPRFAVVTHYTQIVWNDTLFVGCGVANCTNLVDEPGLKLVYVCNYGPGGNILPLGYPYYANSADTLTERRIVTLSLILLLLALNSDL